MTLGRNLSIGFRGLSLISVVPGPLVGASVRFVNGVLREMTAEKPDSAGAYAVES